jgi:ABC-type glycerol-3-phosphate transport system substrate-binding protein
VPKTWDDFMKAAKAVSVNGVKAYAINVDASRYVAGVYSRGGAILSDDQKKAVFNNDQGVAQLGMYGQMVKDGTAYQTAGSNDDGTDFAAQKTTFNFESSARLATYRNNVGGKFNWGVAILPTGPGAGPATDMFGGNITMFKSTPEKQLASWLFIKFFTSAQINPDWSIATGYLPIRASAMNDPRVQQTIASFPQYAVAIQAQQYGKPEPNVRQWNDIRSIIQDAMVAQIADPSKSAKSLMDDAVSKANAALSQ